MFYFICGFMFTAFEFVVSIRRLPVVVDELLVSLRRSKILVTISRVMLIQQSFNKSTGFNFWLYIRLLINEKIL